MGRKVILGLGVLVVLMVTSCQPEAAFIPVNPPTMQPPDQLQMQPTAVPPMQTPPPTIPPTLPPSPTVRATARPAAVLAVPPEWADATRKAVAQLQTSPRWQWQFITADDATQPLSDTQVQLALVNNEEGIIVRQQPLALAVPFTADWEAATLVQAQEIQLNGHTLAVVKPWEELTPDWKALPIDGRHPTDPEYPLQSSWSIVAAPGYEPAAAELAPVLQEQMHKPRVQITAVGDLMLARGLGHVIRQGRLDYPFIYVADWLQTADLTLGNMESALGDIGQPESKRYPFQAPPAAAQALAQAGFDIITLANNHAMDYGLEALRQGIGLLHDQGIATIGAGADRDEAYRAYFAEVNGLRLAFLGYVNVPIEASTGFDTRSWTAEQGRPGLAWGEPDIIRAGVTAVRPQADLVIVLLHSGLEYIEEPSEPQVAAAEAAINAGADLVIGHHAHILQGIDFYQGGVIVYGLGNFAFQIEGDPATAVLNIWLDKDGVRQIELRPAIVQKSGQPRPATPTEAAAIRDHVRFLTTLLNTN